MTDEKKDDLPYEGPVSADDIEWFDKFITRMCSGDRSTAWRMCIPVQRDDSDMICTRILRHLRAQPVADDAGGDDIGTAPRDGSIIDLLYEGKWYSGHWYTHPSVSGWITTEFDCNDYEFEPTRWRSRQPPAADNRKLKLPSNEWLRQKIESEPDGMECEAGLPLHPADNRGVDVEATMSINAIQKAAGVLYDQLQPYMNAKSLGHAPIFMAYSTIMEQTMDLRDIIRTTPEDAKWVILGYLHEVTEPDGQYHKMYSAQEESPWKHWKEDHQAGCRYKRTALFGATPQPEHDKTGGCLMNPIIKELHKRSMGRSYKSLAEELDISPQYLCDILLGRRNISDNVAEKLGYERVCKWRKI